MATANIALSFTSKTPTLEEVLGMLKEIKKISAEKIDLKINATETAKATKQTTDEMRQQKELLKTIKDEVVIAEQSYKRQAINHRQLQKEYGNAINMLREMGNQEKLIEVYSTKIWVTERNITTEVQKQQVASENLHKKIQEGLDKELKLHQNITKEKVKLTDMDKAHAQALKINTQKNTQEATGYNATGNLYGGMFDIYLLRQGINVINSAFKPLVEYEQAIYNLGVVAEKTEGDISSLFNKFQQLSTEIPVSAISLVKATDEITRVGLSYEDAYAVATQGAKLAIASGDKIEGVTDSLAKVLISLEMFGRTEEQVAEITNQMQSVILKTPLSTQTLSEGMRHAAGAMALFVQTSTKSGKELEDYKDKLLQTTLALEGGLARIGRTGSQAGLSIRELYNKLLAPDKAAKKMINENTYGLYYNEITKSINKTKDGIAITSDYIVNLAERELPNAVELISKLYSTGEITSATMKKLLTERLSFIA